MMLTNRIKLILLFLTILFVKITVSLLMNGPFVFSDEPCVAQKAMYFANNLKMETCQNIIQIDIEVQDPAPFYPGLISIIYKFAHGENAYHLVLILNAFLVSILIFPLTGIFKKFIGNTNLAFLLTSIIVLLPQVTAFDNTMLPETLFICLNIWCLYFYINSFEDNRKSALLKTLAILCSIAGIFTQPLGLIMLIAITANEICFNKNRKNVALLYLPLTAISISFVLVLLPPDVRQSILTDINDVTNANLITALKSLKDQLNSFTLAMFLVPLLIFFANFNRKDLPIWQKIKFFTLTFIITHFLIGAYYICGYYNQNNHIGLLTSLPNVSFIYILIFGMIFLVKYQRTKFNVFNIALSGILIIGLLFPAYMKIKYSLNPTVSVFFNIDKADVNNLIHIKPYSLLIITCLYVLLIGLLLAGKNKIVLFLIISILTVQSFFVIKQNIKISGLKAPVVEYFKEKTTNILFVEAVEPKKKVNLISFDYWKLLVVSTNTLNFLPLTKQQILSGAYVISTLKLNLPLEITLNSVTSGLPVKEVNIYKLQKN